MPICPEYRVRIFLSADLVGSTEFKTAAGLAVSANDVHPRWVHSIKQFYRQFPVLLDEKFAQQKNVFDLRDAEQSPKLWKTIGDEIIFCGRVFNLEHFTACITAFVQTLEQYGSDLEGSGQDLDIKGAAWVASFPSPNITVKVYSEDMGSDDQSIGDESDELAADQAPHKFDFLGKDIDTGFRITRHSGADRLAMSGEAALLLCEAANERLFREAFLYGGRQSLKGVMNGKPYPIVNIDTERHRKRREIADLERTLTNANVAEPSTLGRFLDCLFLEEGIAIPILPRRDFCGDAPQAESYAKFKVEWDNIYQEIEEREKAESNAAKADEGGNAAIDPAITDQFDGIAAVHTASPGETESHT